MPLPSPGGRPAFTLPVAVVLALAALSTGCASRADKQKGKTNTALQDFVKSLDTFDARVAASVRSINRLQAPNTYDYERAYMDFMTEFFNVNVDGAAVREQAEFMRDAGVDYFVLAGKEAEAKGDAEQSEELARRQTASWEEYDLLQTRLGQLHEQYGVYRGLLNGVYQNLNRNVTRQRIANLKTQLDAARAQATTVREAIAATKTQAERLSAVAMTKNAPDALTTPAPASRPVGSSQPIPASQPAGDAKPD